jgi:hypothetical protein
MNLVLCPLPAYGCVCLSGVECLGRKTSAKTSKAILGKTKCGKSLRQISENNILFLSRLPFFPHCKSQSKEHHSKSLTINGNLLSKKYFVGYGRPLQTSRDV